VLGGQFTARVNMNIREDKHWAYGAYTLLWDARGQRPFLVYAPVQGDKTKEAVAELRKELHDIISARPPSAEELSRVTENMILELPGSWETNNDVGNSINEIVRFGYPDDYFRTYAEKIKGVTVQSAANAAKKVVQPDKLAWIIVGDRSKIEAGLAELGIGKIQVIDADGNLVSDKVEVMQ
jgi:zinc protease